MTFYLLISFEVVLEKGSQVSQAYIKLFESCWLLWIPDPPVWAITPSFNVLF